MKALWSFLCLIGTVGLLVVLFAAGLILVAAGVYFMRKLDSYEHLFISFEGIIVILASLVIVWLLKR